MYLYLTFLIKTKNW